MKITLNSKKYSLLKEYVDYSNISSVKVDDNTQTITIDDNGDIDAFLFSISDALDIYGFGLDDEITDFGYELEELYDLVFVQTK